MMHQNYGLYYNIHEPKIHSGVKKNNPSVTFSTIKLFKWNAEGQNVKKIILKLDHNLTNLWQITKPSSLKKTKQRITKNQEDQKYLLFDEPGLFSPLITSKEHL